MEKKVEEQEEVDRQNWFGCYNNFIAVRTILWYWRRSLVVHKLCKTVSLNCFQFQIQFKSQLQTSQEKLNQLKDEAFNIWKMHLQKSTQKNEKYSHLSCFRGYLPFCSIYSAAKHMPTQAIKIAILYIIKLHFRLHLKNNVYWLNMDLQICAAYIFVVIH